MQSSYNLEDILKSRDWKNKNKNYITNLQIFFDLVDNIEDENFKNNIIYQMLKCDEALTIIIEDICKKNLK